MLQNQNRREKNRNNLFVSGRVNENQNPNINHSFRNKGGNTPPPPATSSVFSQIFGNQENKKPVPITESINALHQEMNRRPSSSSRSTPKTEEMVSSILEVMNKNKSKLGQQMDRLNRNLQNPRKNAESVEELKSTIRKLYALLFSLYKLHTVPIEKRSTVLQEIKSKLQSNHHFMNVVNRIVFENNQMRRNESGAGSGNGNTLASFTPNMNVGEAMKSMGKNMFSSFTPTPAEPKEPAQPEASLEAIPMNGNASESEGEQLLEEAKEEIPEIVLPESRIQEVVEEAQAEEGEGESAEEEVEVSSVAESKPLNTSLTNQVQNRRENMDLPASSSKKANLSNRLHTILKGLQPINSQTARQKLDAIDASS
jgi:hypothetical protein